MKKQTSPAKTATKAKVTAKSARTANKSKTPVKTSKTVKSPKKTIAAKKKTTQRKGLLHHTKRVYHMTPKFVHGMLIGAVVGLGVVSWIGSTGQAHANPASNPCIKTRSIINVNLQNANVDVNTNDCETNRTFILKAWYAPAANGIPHDAQRLFADSKTVVVNKNNKDWTRLAVNMVPQGCFYQIDLVDITNPPNGEGYPIVRAALGGDHDCTPNPEYSCTAMSVSKGADRQVTINSFRTTAENATLDHVVIYWNFPSTQMTDSYKGTALGAHHKYAKDGTYKIYALAYFKITNNLGDEAVRVTKQACTATVAFASVVPPGKQEVCELKSGHIIQIAAGPYNTAQYGPTNAKECNPVVAELSSSSSTTSTLAKTGPGAVLAILVFASIGGYISHHAHRHVKTKRHHRKAHHKLHTN